MEIQMSPRKRTDDLRKKLVKSRRRGGANPCDSDLEYFITVLRGRRLGWGGYPRRAVLLDRDHKCQLPHRESSK
jgi:hypothetical protein